MTWHTAADVEGPGSSRAHRGALGRLLAASYTQKFRACPSLRESGRHWRTTTDPHLELYLDGSAAGGADVGVAAWGFMIVANVPLYLGQAIEVVDGNTYIVLKRYGRGSPPTHQIRSSSQLEKQTILEKIRHSLKPCFTYCSRRLVHVTFQ